MLQRFQKALAAVCIFALVLSAMPQTVSAATDPVWGKTHTTLYENGPKNGVLTYTVKRLTPGQTIVWGLSGTGSDYATLAKTNTKVTSKKVSNTVTIRTYGDLNARNKTVNVTAKIYDKNGNYLNTLSSGDAKIKIRPTTIEIVSTSLPSTLLIGTPYQFNYRITPANSTCSVTWTATRSDGTDASDCITKGGTFTAKQEGTYTITVSAKIGSKLYAARSTTVKVGNTLTGVKQIGMNKILATYAADARTLVRRETFALKNSYGLNEVIKDIEFSEDGTQVTITTYSSFVNGAQYTLADGFTTESFTATVGKPVTLELLTTIATVNKDTPLKYALYDANGIDVTDLYPGTFSCYPQIINGYLLTDSQHIRMTSIGDKGILHMTFTFRDPAMVPLQATGTIICVAATPSGETNFTLTDSPETPDYNAASYKDNYTIAEGKFCFMHFRALDTDKDSLVYDSITYTSSAPDSLVINNSGNGVATALAVKSGRVTVLVTARYGDQIHSHSFTVEITPPSYLTTLRADRTLVYTSNAYPAGSKQYINLTAYDQFGQSFDLVNESYQIIDNNGYKPNLVSYDPAANRIAITPAGCPAGSYYYTLTLTANGQAKNVGFTVLVQSPLDNGTVSYQVEINSPILDLNPSSDTNPAEYVSSKTLTIRLAEYRGGIFYRYADLISARITRSGVTGFYYFPDLTQSPVTTAFDIPVTDAVLDPRIVLNTVTLNNSVYSKATAGVYNVELRFHPANSPNSVAVQTASFELQDSQTSPKVTVTRIIADAPCNTALALAKHCLSVSNGEIVNCVVTGSQISGDVYTLQAGEAINIRSVTVRLSTRTANGQILFYDVSVDVGKTLMNQ